MNKQLWGKKTQKQKQKTKQRYNKTTNQNLRFGGWKCC